ncbi:MAG: PQQ-dependent sugar dehydrogenase [Proteobacteria bacterium]|nr:PQQ-dependent sugar dehydrogenase [Pseudomonadota bacterium]
MFPYTRYFVLMMTGVLLAFSLAVTASPRVTTILEELDRPWSVDWISDKKVLITERGGRLLLINLASDTRQTINNVPAVTARGQGGLLDVRVRRIDNDLWVYLALAGTRSDNTTGTELWRGRLIDDQLLDVEQLFSQSLTTDSGHHFGGRLALTDEHVFLTIGDRGDRERAQDPTDTAGSVVRLRLDGSLPPDNPWVGDSQYRPELYSIGHRNPQGLAFDADGVLYAHEHGPQGGDEINRIEPGLNYGWPTITYGRNYGIGTAIGEGVAKKGLEQPLLHWNPSIAPSGMAFSIGQGFPEWQNSLFVGALKAQMLVRLVFEDGQFKQKERLLQNSVGRIRDVRQGPDGAIYLLTDSTRGKLIRVTP